MIDHWGLKCPSKENPELSLQNNNFVGEYAIRLTVEGEYGIRCLGHITGILLGPVILRLPKISSFFI